jgi:hypothetical protein
MPTHRRSFIFLLLASISIACAPPATVRMGGDVTGAPSGRHAVEQFMGAVQARDIQAMTAVWGTARGSIRENIERNEVERRAIIMQCFLAHNQFRILSDNPGEGGRRMIRGDITRGNVSRQTTFQAVRGPGDRWYVETVDMSALRDFCGEAGA